MAFFISLQPNIEISNNSVWLFLNSIARGREQRTHLLQKYNFPLTNDANTWHDQQKWLNCFKEIHETFGDMHVFLLGISFTKKHNYPREIGIKKALELMNIIYHAHHKKNGKIMYNRHTKVLLDGIGSYDLELFDEENRKAILTSYTPYPNKFEEGILHGILSHFKPDVHQPHSITIDETRPTRAKGGNSCTYLISW